MLTNISFNKADKNTTLPNRVALKSFIEKQLGKEGLKVECLQYVFCSDKYLLDINKTFLKHNYYTDIISFDLSEHKGTLIADVYISIDRVKENAKTLKVPYQQELLRVLFHGALHFCGYKDKKPADAKKMRSMEDKWIKSYLKMFHVERSK
ncbi:MAG: rRNA maturation RNase YbeY [Chitinophagaceae bacterium]|jgi:rRNA maturation RNase YbeY